MKDLNNTSRKTQYRSTKSVFKKFFRTLELDADNLTKQFEKAEKQFPVLMLGYKISVLYARYLEKTNMSLSRGRISYTPHPDGEVESVITYPPIIEKKDIWQELEEYSEALIEAGTEYEAETATEIRNCIMIRQDYLNAQGCVRRYIENPPQTDEEWDEYFDCLDKLALYASEMRSHNCHF